MACIPYHLKGKGKDQGPGRKYRNNQLSFVCVEKAPLRRSEALTE